MSNTSRFLNQNGHKRDKLDITVVSDITIGSSVITHVTVCLKKISTKEEEEERERELERQKLKMQNP